MRIKTILSLTTFAIAFIVSAAVAAVFSPSQVENVAPLTFDTTVTVAPYNKTTAQIITRFLEQDIRNGNDRNREDYSFEEDATLSSRNIVKRAKAVSEYANESASMDDSVLPQDVQLAWLKHMRAWHNYSDFLQNAKMQKMSYSETSRLENQYNREINTTWYEVLRVAARHGAVVEDF